MQKIQRISKKKYYKNMDSSENKKNNVNNKNLVQENYYDINDPFIDDNLDEIALAAIPSNSLIRS